MKNFASEIKTQNDAGVKKFFIAYQPATGVLYTLMKTFPNAVRIGLDYGFDERMLCELIRKHKDKVIIFDTGTVLHSSTNTSADIRHVLAQVLEGHVNVPGIADFDFTGTAIITTWETNQHISDKMNMLKDRAVNIDTTVL